jgi:hypothetical protein
MRTLTPSPVRMSPEVVVAASARGLTRRRLLGNAGNVGLGAALASAYLGRRDVAYAGHYSDQNAGYCGPSPVCGCSRCDYGSNAQCDGVESGIGYTANWVHGNSPCSSSCEGPRYRGQCRNNCWPEGPNSYWCCDCCVHNAGQRFDKCTGCGWDESNWWKCICEANAC